MILETKGDQGGSIGYILKKKPNAKYVKSVQDYSSKQTMHVTGLNLKHYLSLIDYFEKAELLELRQKYSPSNEDFYGRLHRPIDKIWTARGGSANYYISDGDKAKLLGILANVKDGYSLRKWLETFWLLPSHYDPMGMIFMEVGDNTTYPTYKSCHDVFDFPPPKGREYDYIVFKCDDKIKQENAAEGKETDVYYRVVDDAFDYLVRWDGDTAHIIESQSYPNYFDKVPAITNGNIYDPINKWYVSADDEITGVADQYLRDRSVLTMFKMQHGFPIKWLYGSDCPTCNGTKKVSGKNCPSCAGTGRKSKYDVSETIVVPFPKANDPMPPEYAGFYTPPIETWEMMNETIEGLFKDAHYTKWGTNQLEDNSSDQPATATGRFIDVQPVNDRLGKYTDSLEFVETWVVDKIGEFNFPATYKGCEINEGRRYLIESPDVIWKKYQDARTAGAPTTSLTFLYMQWIQAEFRSDSMELGRQVKLMKLDTFFHVSLSQAATIITNPDDYIRKIYFEEWVNQLKPNDLITKTLDELRTMRDEYLDKIVATKNDEAAKAAEKELQLQSKYAPKKQAA